MNETINNFKPFDTIAGINQIEEIENYILPETIIITMDDIWSLYKKRFPKNIDVYFVNLSEEDPSGSEPPPMSIHSEPFHVCSFSSVLL